MSRVTSSLLNGLLATLVATAVAYAVGRDRRIALAAGLLSGSLTALASLVGGSDQDARVAGRVTEVRDGPASATGTRAADPIR